MNGDRLLTALGHWFPQLRRAEVRPVAAAGFSGASVWQVQSDAGAFALRRWTDGKTSHAVEVAHGLQTHLANGGLDVVPRLQRTVAGNTWTKLDLALWELADWKCGAASYWREPTTEKLVAAFTMLAQVHRRAEGYQRSTSAKRPTTFESLAALLMPQEPHFSPALARRSDRLIEALTGGSENIHAGVQAWPCSEERDLARSALALVERVLPTVAAVAAAWTAKDLPLQWRLCDVWHDHVLFTGDCVTGLVDYGAVDFDAPIGDIARLLGSLVGDDRQRRQIALEAYDAVRPLTANEWRAVDVFDRTGTVLSTLNWLRWLYVEPPVNFRTQQRPAALERLGKLFARLQTFAEMIDSI